MKPSKNSLSEEDKAFLIALARASIISGITGVSEEVFEPPKSRTLIGKRGCFVTIKKNNELRGYTGYILPKRPLYKAIEELAIESATGDSRFPAVKKEELEEISIEISVLSSIQRINSIDEIQIGRDGLYITKGENSGVLLPQVAVEEKWSREKFLEQLCWKAGLPSDGWKGAELYHFSAEVFGDES